MFYQDLHWQQEPRTGKLKQLGTKTSEDMTQNKPSLLKGICLWFFHRSQIFDIFLIPFSGVPIYPKSLKPVLTDIIWYFSILKILKFVYVEYKLHAKQSLSIAYILIQS